MDSQAKRTLIATLACIVVLFGWAKLQEKIYGPPRPLAATSEPAEPGSPVPPTTAGTTAAPAQVGAAPIASAEGATYEVVGGRSDTPIRLGDPRKSDRKGGFVNPWELEVQVDPRGAGVDTIRMSQHRNEIARDRRNPGEDPYDLVQPVIDPKTGVQRISFVTERIRLVEEKQDIDLSRVTWAAEKKEDGDSQSAILRAEVRRGGQPVLEVVKTYRLRRGSYHLERSITVENRSPVGRRVVVVEGGPIGFRNEDPQRDSRRVVAALTALEKDDKGNVRLDPAGQPAQLFSIGETHMRADLLKQEGAGKEMLPGDRHTLWTALGNKYFACISTWLPRAGTKQPFADYLGKVRAYVAADEPVATVDLYVPSDVTFEQVLSPADPIASGGALTLRGEIYCGPKDDALLDDPARLPEGRARHYALVTQPDRAGCTFQSITAIMRWLLNHLYRLTGNYGVAIIILVLIVRLVLHPVTKRGQIGMMRMQKQMAAMKPKLDLVQQQYKNDKQKLNEEMMKVYREHGVSPGGQMLGCLPMLLQMPIWVALWTTLNTNVGMRHMPFFGWIRDLSAPDGFYSPHPPWNIHIPLISGISGPIHAFNLLPIIMALTMYAQQKLTQKLTKPATPPKPVLDAEGNPVPDQMAQQQKIMNFMMIFFGFMFYNFPSGLNLYILTSNLLGMGEQWLIRKHIREKEARGEFEPAAADRRTGPSLWERLQKRAEDARMAQSQRALSRPKGRGKAPRF